MYFWNKWPNTIVVFAKAAVVAYRRVTMLTILNQEIPNRFLNQKMQNSAFSWCRRIFKEGGSGISCCWPCSEKVLGKSLSWMGILWSIFGMPACSNYTCVTQERYLEGWFSLPAILAIFCQVLTKAFSASFHLFFFVVVVTIFKVRLWQNNNPSSLTLKESSASCIMLARFCCWKDNLWFKNSLIVWL